VLIANSGSTFSAPSASYLSEMISFIHQPTLPEPATSAAHLPKEVAAHDLAVFQICAATSEHTIGRGPFGLGIRDDFADTSHRCEPPRAFPVSV